MSDRDKPNAPLTEEQGGEALKVAWALINTIGRATDNARGALRRMGLVDASAVETILTEYVLSAVATGAMTRKMPLELWFGITVRSTLIGLIKAGASKADILSHATSAYLTPTNPNLN